MPLHPDLFESVSQENTNVSTNGYIERYSVGADSKDAAEEPKGYCNADEVEDRMPAKYQRIVDVPVGSISHHKNVRLLHI